MVESVAISKGRSQLEGMDYWILRCSMRRSRLLCRRLSRTSTSEESQSGGAKGANVRPISPWRANCFYDLRILPSDRSTWSCSWMNISVRYHTPSFQAKGAGRVWSFWREKSQVDGPRKLRSSSPHSLGPRCVNSLKTHSAMVRGSDDGRTCWVAQPSVHEVICEARHSWVHLVRTLLWLDLTSLIFLQGDDIQNFDTSWDQAPSPSIEVGWKSNPESLYTMRTRKHESLKNSGRYWQCPDK